MTEDGKQPNTKKKNKPAAFSINILGTWGGKGGGGLKPRYSSDWKQDKTSSKRSVIGYDKDNNLSYYTSMLCEPYSPEN